MKKKHSGYPAAPSDTHTCYWCRSYSKTGHIEGFCLTHRRMTRASAKEPCYK